MGSAPAGALVCSGESPVVNVLVRPEVVILEDGKWAAFSTPAGEYDGAFRAAVHRAEAAVMAPSLAANGQHVAVAPPVYSEGRTVAEVSRGRPVLVPSSATAYRMVDEGAGVSVVVDAKDFAAVPGLLADAGTDGWLS